MDIFTRRIGISLEIQSFGGIYNGRVIQDRDIHTSGYARRNPVIADLFHRMRFMEWGGGGLTKILSETSWLPGCSRCMRSEVFSTPSDLRVVLKNVNYFVSGCAARKPTSHY
ncbi:MAG: hypothetical protein CVV52_03255 [Spirochaetae bacterium HGW-Spirochaetae-8]|nr:MAG: hypothetical protein CVV52_03255 [Spirochaetae bacterium HGW-Spirochaetae-8]